MTDSSLNDFILEPAAAAGEPEPSGCAACGSAEIEPDWQAPFCAGCRRELSQRPLPLWIRITGVAVGLALAVAMTQWPSSLQAGVAFERGEAAEKAKNYPGAVAEYRKVIQRFPDSTEVLAHLAISHFRAGQLSESMALIERLEGREAPDKETLEELNGIVDELNAIVGQINATSEGAERAQGKTVDQKADGKVGASASKKN